MGTERYYDIGIVGAGPAGAFFAQRAAEVCPDLKILLINGQNEQRSKPCGGLLSPDAQKAFAKFDLALPKALLSDPQIFYVETVDLVKKCARRYQRHYLNMDRFSFDSWFLSELPCTVEVINDRCLDITEKDGRYIIHLLSGDVDAGCVVGADGGNSIVRRRLIGKMPKSYIAIQEHYNRKSEKIPFYTCVFDRKTSDSCSWSIRKEDALIFGGAFEKKSARDNFEKQKERFEDFFNEKLGVPVKREACLVTSPRKFSDFCCGRENVYLLGEAAGFISSSSFEGISGAILSAGLLADAFSKSTQKSEILKIYKKQTFLLRMKLYFKVFKRKILCSQFLRNMIMKSKICSIK